MWGPSVLQHVKINMKNLKPFCLELKFIIFVSAKSCKLNSNVSLGLIAMEQQPRIESYLGRENKRTWKERRELGREREREEGDGKREREGQ